MSHRAHFAREQSIVTAVLPPKFLFGSSLLTGHRGIDVSRPTTPNAASRAASSRSRAAGGEAKKIKLNVQARPRNVR